MRWVSRNQTMRQVFRQREPCGQAVAVAGSHGRALFCQWRPLARSCFLPVLGLPNLLPSDPAPEYQGGSGARRRRGATSRPEQRGVHTVLRAVLRV